MPVELSVVTGGTVPIYRQIMDQVCRAVVMGRLESGEQMPSVRVLAEELVLNPNTVSRAYAELIRDGVLEGHQGKGVFVAQRRPVFTKAERVRRLEEAVALARTRRGLHGWLPTPSGEEAPQLEVIEQDKMLSA